jgi:hypothetical protein
VSRFDLLRGCGKVGHRDQYVVELQSDERSRPAVTGQAGTRQLTPNAVGICPQARRGADGRCAVDRVRRAVGAGRAAAAEEGAALSLSGPQTAAGSASVAGDLVRAAHRDRLAARAGRTRIRLGRDLLAALGRVAAGRGLAGAACSAAGTEGDNGKPVGEGAAPPACTRR